MFELSFATAGQETARVLTIWQRPEGLGTGEAQRLPAPLLRPLVLSAAGKASRPGVSYQRPA